MAWPDADRGLRFEVHRAIKAAPGNGAWWRWRWTRGGEPVGNIDYAVTIEATGAGELRLSYRCDDRSFRQTFSLTSAPCRFGGRRWFVACPRTGRRVSKLYSIGGAGFHSRHAYGRLAYACQRDALQRDRALRRRDRILFGKLKGDDPEFVPKPKWMRWRTYRHWMARLDAAEAACDRHLAAMLARLG